MMLVHSGILVVVEGWVRQAPLIAAKERQCRELVGVFERLAGGQVTVDLGYGVGIGVGSFSAQRTGLAPPSPHGMLRGVGKITVTGAVVLECEDGVGDNERLGVNIACGPSGE